MHIVSVASTGTTVSLYADFKTPQILTTNSAPLPLRSRHLLLLSSYYLRRKPSRSGPPQPSTRDSFPVALLTARTTKGTDISMSPTALCVKRSVEVCVQIHGIRKECEAFHSLFEPLSPPGCRPPQHPVLMRLVSVFAASKLVHLDAAYRNHQSRTGYSDSIQQGSARGGVLNAHPRGTSLKLPYNMKPSALKRSSQERLL